MLHIHVSVQWHDEIDDAYVYEMKCTFVGAKHLGCYKRERNACVMKTEENGCMHICMFISDISTHVFSFDCMRGGLANAFVPNILAWLCGRLQNNLVINNFVFLYK